LDVINILVIEDDREINQLISKYLSKEGYQVISVFDGREALIKLSSEMFQLVILDLMLPYVDGYEVLRKIRGNSKIPVLILTSKCEETEKIIGLGLGADDYMTKPFSIGELTARVKAQIRRYLFFSIGEGGRENQVLKHLGIEMNLDNHMVKIDDEAVMLTAKEFEILKLFMSNPQKVFTKTQVFNSVWGEEYMNDENTVMVHIRRLREKVEKDPSNPRYIQTVWGIGYKLTEV
jgi:DNA-binding response OmpR family regulator